MADHGGVRRFAERAEVPAKAEIPAQSSSIEHDLADSRTIEWKLAEPRPEMAHLRWGIRPWEVGTGAPVIF
jgi:hypothetical protein